MPAISLSQILGLVGTLDDSPGQATGRERFRSYLRESVSELGVVRDYVESCLRESDVQYARALQDLINHVGRLMDFDVEFGRYSGVTGEIGHDGLWIAGELAIVVEVKKKRHLRDRYLGSERLYRPAWKYGAAPSGRSSAMGLYVVGQSRQDLQQLRNSIMAEERTHQLRVSSVDSILSLAELIESGRIERDEAVALLRPTQVVVDETVGVLARVAAAEPVSADTDTPTEPSRPSAKH